MNNEDKKLTARQSLFVTYYIETGNASEAARRAGYSKKTAFRMGQENLQKPAIKAAIAEEMAKKEAASIAKADEVLKFLTRVLRGEVTDEQIVVIGKGDGFTEATREEVRASIKDRIKAAEQLLKRYPGELDKAEQKARIKRLEAELTAMEAEQAITNDDVTIVDDIGGEE